MNLQLTVYQKGTLEKRVNVIVMENVNKNEVMVIEDMSKKSPVERLDKKKVGFYLDQIRVSYRKTVESILELAAVVVHANEQLNEKEWKSLEQQFGNKSDLSRLLAIGRALPIFKRHTDKLPNSVVSLYTLASKMDPTEIEEKIQSGDINAYTTNADASKLVGKGVVVNTDRASANVVKLIVRTSEQGEASLKLHPEEVLAALDDIRRGYVHLETLGYTVVTHDFKKVDVDATAELVEA